MERGRAARRRAGESSRRRPLWLTGPAASTAQDTHDGANAGAVPINSPLGQEELPPGQEKLLIGGHLSLTGETTLAEAESEKESSPPAAT